MNHLSKIIIFTLGALYLVVELAFNVTLLDTLGGKFDRELMENLEEMGKIISGVGLWILTLKLIDLARMKFGMGKTSTFFVAGLSLIASIATMTHVQDSVVEYVTETSTGVERKTAYAIAVSMNEIADGNTVVKGFEFSKEDFAKSEGKTYLAILPGFAISQPNAEDIFTKAGLKSIYNIKYHEAEVQGQKAWESYAKVNQEIRDLYNNKYLPASKKYLSAKTSVNPSVYWNQYIDELDRKGVDMYNTPPSDRWVYPRVIQELRNKGLNMPAGWRLDDKDTFYRVVRSKASSSESFKSAVYKHAKIKTNLPPNLSWNDFSNSKEVQDQIKAKASFDTKGNISLNMTRKVFFDKYVYPEMKKRASTPETMLMNRGVAFEGGGTYEKEGKDAVKRVKLPLVALGLSCFFALLNGTLLATGLFSFMGTPGKVVGAILSVALITIWVVKPLDMTNKITASEYFDISVNRTADHIKYPVTWLANMQPLMNDTFGSLKGLFSFK